MTNVIGCQLYSEKSGGGFERIKAVFIVMKILALITARGGSKRLPGKNIKLLGGQPLIAWSIGVAKNIPDICDILVTTDDEGIAGVARSFGALVPWLRPANLANDTASSVDVALHALNWYENENGKVDGLLLLQPTSPFRTRETVLRGVTVFRENKGQSVLGVSPAKSHPMWCFSVNDQIMQPFMDGGGLHLRSQDLPPAYEVNGAFYLIAPDQLRATSSFYGEGVIPLIMDEPKESIDIDTEWDFLCAEALVSL
jgi:CMP-N,N'-diacetyllegionaminic acid synthase